MLKQETRYKDHITEQFNKAMATGNWALFISVLRQSHILSSSDSRQLYIYIADQIGAVICKNMRFIQRLRRSEQIPLGDLLLELDDVSADVYGLGQLSRSKMDEFAKTVNTAQIALRLQEDLLSRGSNIVNIEAKSSPAAYISKSVKPVKEIYELYQWASIQSPEYYDTLLNVHDVLTILETETTNEVPTILDTMLDAEYRVQRIVNNGIDNVCNQEHTKLKLRCV